MGICQSRPDDAEDGAACRPSSSKPSSLTSSSSTTANGGLVGGLRRRPSETSVCTIIPEATDHDNDQLHENVWKDDADADSLTGRGLVYNKSMKALVRGQQQQQKGGNGAAEAVSSPALTEPTVLTGMASPFTPVMAAASSSPAANANAANATASSPASVSSASSSSIMYPRSPIFGAAAIVNPPNNNSAILHEYDDDDSTAMPLEEEDDDDDDDQAPTDEDNDDDELGPGRLVPANNKKMKGVVINAAAASSPIRPATTALGSPSPSRLGDAPGWRAANIVPKRVVAAGAAPLPAATTSSADVVVADDNDAAEALEDSHLDTTTGSSIVLSPGAASFVSGASTSAAAAAVSPMALSEFRKIQLQAQRAQVQKQRNAKAMKYKDRRQDVQGYKQLYQHFQELSKRVVRSNKNNNKEEEGGDVDDAGGGAEMSAVSETVTTETAQADADADAGAERLLSPTSKTTSDITTPVVAAAAAATSTTSSSSAIRKAKSFDLQNANNWFFDFQGTDFEEGGGGMTAASLKQQGQAGLSLLSESSLEVQRRLYAEKRRQRKQLGNHNKKTSSSKSWRQQGTPSVRGTPSLEVDGDGTGLVPSPSRATTTTPMLGNLVSTVSSIVRRDYGPVTRTPRNNPMPLAEDADYGPPAKMKSPTEGRSGAAEWVDQEINCVGNAGTGGGGGDGGGPEDAEYSYVSDMGDTASYTSNDYYRSTSAAAARRFPASQYPTYSYSRPVVSGGGGAPRTDVTPEKLNELEAKVKALQKRNAELAATAGTHSPSSGGGAEGATSAADCAMSPLAASTTAAASNDTFKTPVATNRVASLRSIFEPSSKQTDQVGGSRNQEAQGYGVTTHPVGSVGQSDPSDSVASLSMPILTFEEPVHQLESIEESLISASSSVAMQSEDCESPTKSLLGEDRAAAESPSEPSFVDTTQGQAVDDDDVYQVDAPEESIDLPPAEDEDSVGLIAEESVPITTIGSDIPPLQGLDTVSTGTSLADDDVEKAEEEKKDESNEEADAGSTSVGTPVKSPASSTSNAVLTPVEKASDDDIGVLARDDSAEDATQLEIFTPMKPQGSVIEGAHSPALSMPVAYQVSKKVPMDPPGAAMLDGTPSLETKRQAPRPTDSLLSPMAVRTASTPPTPHVSPIRRMPVDSSPAGGPSPQKNRWIAEMSTHQFLAMSEENALERLARLERNGAKKQTAYGLDSESQTLILEEDALLEEEKSPASALFPDESIDEGASASPSTVGGAACDSFTPEESSSQAAHGAVEPVRLDAIDSSTESVAINQDKKAYEASASVDADPQAGNEDLGPLVDLDVDASVTASSSAATADPAKESIHGSSEDANPVNDDDELANFVDDALAEEEPIQDPEATSPTAVNLSEDMRKDFVAPIEAVHEVAETTIMNQEESTPQQECVTADGNPSEARSSVNTAATSFVTAISSSAVLMEAWDDTTSVSDPVYTSFGEGGNSAPVLLDATKSIAAEASTVDASLQKVDAPPLQLSPTEGSIGGGGVVIDKSFASIARVSPVILVADKVSSSSTTTTRGYLSGSMRPSLETIAAPKSGTADFDDAPDDELHSDESMSIYTSKSHISHDVEGDTTSCHSGSTRPSTNVCVTNPTKLNMTLEPSSVEPSAMDLAVPDATTEPSRLSSTTSTSPSVPWSESLALASVVGQQVQDVLERYRSSREAVDYEGDDDNDNDAPDDELRASSKPTPTTTTNP